MGNTVKQSSDTRPSAAILVSGGGSNLQAFIDAVATDQLALDLCVVLSNKADAKGLVRARKAGIPALILEHTHYPERKDFDSALIDKLGPYSPDIIILAGFMRILTAVFVTHFAGRILNIHPSLLPKYTGLQTHQRALDAGDRWHGSTVHFVTEQLDGGPRIMQGRVPVLPDDTAQTLASRVLKVEHQIYPQVAELFAAGRLKYHAGQAWLDSQALAQPLQFPAHRQAADQ